MRVVVISGSARHRMELYHQLEERDDIDLVVVSYELFRQDINHFVVVHEAKPFSITYCDEMHKVKNVVSSRVGQAIHLIYTKQRYGITATPVINELIDSYNILTWLGVMPYNLMAFHRKFCILDGHGKVLQYKNVGEFKTLLQSNMLRRLKTQVLDLPPVIPKNIYVDLTPAQKKLYKEVEKAEKDYVFEDLEFEDIPTELAKHARLMQVAESAEIVGGVPGKTGSAKLAALEELLEEIVERGEKAVVFTRSRIFCNIMYEYFHKYNPAVIHGDISAQAKKGEEVSPRQQQVDKFQEDPTCKVTFCVSYAAREGVTLTAANNIISTSKDWSPAYESQKLGRIYRYGQEGGSTGSINAYSILANDTIDQRIEDLLEEKQFYINSSVDQPLSTEQILKVLDGK